jgi:hypothetical protein
VNKTKILEFLPGYLGEEGDPVPSDLIGSKIIAFGTYSESELNFEGGLIIEYQTADGSIKRLELGFTELGMWIQK